MKLKFLLVTIIGFFLLSCSAEKQIPSEFAKAVEELTLKYAPDKRIALFDVEYAYDNGKLIISSESDNQDALNELQMTADNLLDKDSYALNISKLPSTEFGDTTYAIVKISVAHIRKMPKFSAELIDQSIMGTTLKLLKKNREYFLVQTPYNYLGWITGSSFVRSTKNEVEQWQNAKKIMVNSNYAQVFSDKSSSALPISDAAYGCEMKYVKSSGSWYDVILPDGRTGVIEKKYCEPVADKIINPNKLLKTAKSFMGIPYLWGGNSSKGFDCSGFSQTVYKSQGILLPRDANMQVNLGERILPDEEFSKVKEGDLLFFGPNEEKITHVGISIGGPLFIHSSGTVHINSLSYKDENFDEFEFKRLRYIKRIVKD